MKDHSVVGITSEGDYFQATCLGCGWKSDLESTRREAKDAHIEHVADVAVAALRKP